MNPNDFLTENENLNEERIKARQEVEEQKKHDLELSQVLNAVAGVGTTVSQAIQQKSDKVSVTNFPTSIKTPDIERLVVEIKSLKDKVSSDAEDKKTHDLLTNLLDAVKCLPTEQPEMPEGVEEVTVKNQKDYDKKFDAVVSAVQAIKMDFQPNIVVKPADVKTEKIELTKLENKLDVLTKAVQAISIVVPEQDDSELLKRISATTKAINSLSFPVPNYILPFKDSTGAAVQALVDDDGKLNVDIDMSTEGIATEATLAIVAEEWVLYGTTDTGSISYITQYLQGTSTWTTSKIDFSTGLTSFATVANNPSITTPAAAHTGAATLTYGNL